MVQEEIITSSSQCFNFFSRYNQLQSCLVQVPLKVFFKDCAVVIVKQRPFLWSFSVTSFYILKNRYCYKLKILSGRPSFRNNTKWARKTLWKIDKESQIFKNVSTENAACVTIYDWNWLFLNKTVRYSLSGATIFICLCL